MPIYCQSEYLLFGEILAPSVHLLVWRVIEERVLERLVQCAQKARRIELQDHAQVRKRRLLRLVWSREESFLRTSRPGNTLTREEEPVYLGLALERCLWWKRLARRIPQSGQDVGEIRKHLFRIQHEVTFLRRFSRAQSVLGDGQKQGQEIDQRGDEVVQCVVPYEN